MNTIRLVLLPEAADAPPRVLRIDAAGRLLADAAPAPAERTVLAVPAAAIALLRLELPSRSSAQARAAAVLLASERLALRPRALHVALGTDGRAAGGRLVAAVEGDILQAWLDRAAAAGVAADLVVPDCLLLPPPLDDSCPQVVELDGSWLVRGEEVAFSAEAKLARAVLGDAPAAPVRDPAERDALLARGALAPPLDLLQGAFARHTEHDAVAPRRRLLALAAALALSPALLWLADAVRHEAAARSLAARSDALAAEVLGPAADVADLAAARAERDAARGFARATAPLFAALETVPGVAIQRLDYAPDGSLSAVLVHADPDAAEPVRAALASGAMAVEAAPGDAGTTTLTLRPQS
ncbi:type II secretion system protein GspL [Coralloluteibacterium stylophorae]|uniref:Type II secretion system protein GspL n=2 Tax=Coralloluteibacterium stylophorae TaxID=1776034 RepID=A0AAP2CEV2_9GAMM|nr:type II secretion system protein GspL [Coralloluteibacterium stylophorae]MBS7458929.1 type II secretion system protein GspL [Coralloluteibacterium stylophorae]